MSSLLINILNIINIILAELTVNPNPKGEKPSPFWRCNWLYRRSYSVFLHLDIPPLTDAHAVKVCVCNLCLFLLFFCPSFRPFAQGSSNGRSGPSWWWWLLASRGGWCSCMCSVRSTSSCGGDSRPTTGSYTSRTAQTPAKSWRWRSPR